MRIYSMTATFGKLNHQTLELKPGLNVISAPNEWGKSTWCAFIIAMFYGIETRQQSTKTALADKERFSPWSNAPMSGRMELQWNGRDITLERSTKGRIPFGEFRAYETLTGLDVPELTAANCGQMLLGVERSVFTRSGFIRLQDMPLTQDESLRRRLNNLVTTGDENSAADRLSKQLRELKNKIRFNRSGLLPQAEYERETLYAQLQQRTDLQAQAQRIRQRQAQLEEQIRLLENHSAALQYQAHQQAVEKIQQAKELCETLEQELCALQEKCATLPDRETATEELKRGQLLQQQAQVLEERQANLSPAPALPGYLPCFAKLTPEQALSQAREDAVNDSILKKALHRAKRWPVFWGIGAAVLAVFALCTLLLQISNPLVSIAPWALLGLSALVFFPVYAAFVKKKRNALSLLESRYPGLNVSQWVEQAEQYAQQRSRYTLELQSYTQAQSALEESLAQYAQEVSRYAGEHSLQEQIDCWQDILSCYEQLSALQQRTQNARTHAEAMQSVSSHIAQPAFPDTLHFDADETERTLTSARFELRQLQLELGQAIGQADSVGEEAVLQARLDAISRRISRLEEHYRALEVAQEALHQASSALQRRFAPRISKRAQEYFCQLTDGRYQRITLSDDFSLSACAEDEDVLRGTLWRSDGTVDQLYLALRLAVAQELTPDAPVVLDDALVRFDDTRLTAALSLLQNQAQDKQILLFSCQQREQSIIESRLSE